MNSTSKQKILIVGADSQIGASLVRHYENKNQFVWKTTRRTIPNGSSFLKLDLSENIDSWAVPDASLAFLCAAVTTLKECSENPAGTAVINVHHTVRLAERLARAGMRVIYLSTNLVFNGASPYPKETDPVSPVTEYGRQKAEAETRLIPLNRLLVVRLTKVLAQENSLLQSWISDLRAGKEVHPYSDLPLSPLSMDFAVSILAGAGESNLNGILHVSAEKDISYAEAAATLAEKINARPELVKPQAGKISMGSVPWPLYSSLEASRLQSELNVIPPSPYLALDQWLGTGTKGVTSRGNDKNPSRPSL